MSKQHVRNGREGKAVRISVAEYPHGSRRPKQVWVSPAMNGHYIPLKLIDAEGGGDAPGNS